MKVTKSNLDVFLKSIRSAGTKHSLPARMTKAARTGDDKVKHTLKTNAQLKIFAEAQKKIGTPEALRSLSETIEVASQRVRLMHIGKFENKDAARSITKRHLDNEIRQTQGELGDLILDDYEVLACSTNAAGRLRLPSSVAGIDQTGIGINRPLNDNDARGICFGRSVQFLISTMSGIDDGEDVEKAAIAGTTDSRNFAKGAIKHQYVAMERSRKNARDIAPLQQVISDARAKVAKAENDSERLRAEAELKVAKASVGATLISARSREVENAGLSVKEAIFRSNEIGQSPVEQAIDRDGACLISDRQHAIGYFSYQGTHYIMDPNRGLLKTQNDGVAQILIEHSLPSHDLSETRVFKVGL